MSTQAELEAALAKARNARDLGDVEDDRAAVERDKSRAEWERTRIDYYKSRDAWEKVRDSLDKASPDYEIARTAWASARSDWDKVDAEYARITVEDAKIIDERRNTRVERDAAYNAAFDALDELNHNKSTRRKELEAALEELDRGVTLFTRALSPRSRHRAANDVTHGGEEPRHRIEPTRERRQPLGHRRERTNHQRDGAEDRFAGPERWITVVKVAALELGDAHVDIRRCKRSVEPIRRIVRRRQCLERFT